MARKKLKIEVEAPPAEQQRHSRFDLSDVTDKGRGGVTITIGKAYRRKPMIDVLGSQGVFSDAELKALHFYRHHADLADRSPMRDSLDRTVRVMRGDGPSAALLTATRVRDDCERAAGSLRDILRAIVVYDQSLSQWAMERSGATEECTDRNGRRVCQMKPRRKALDIARLEIQMAAKRVRAELEA